MAINVIAINKLTKIAEYWAVDSLISNDGIQNTLIRNRFCEIPQNLRFADNRQGFQDETRDR